MKEIIEKSVDQALWMSESKVGKVGWTRTGAVVAHFYISSFNKYCVNFSLKNTRTVLVLTYANYTCNICYMLIPYHKIAVTLQSYD